MSSPATAAKPRILFTFMCILLGCRMLEAELSCRRGATN
jgi:hypothetical protein